jgi:hypothetical protein
MAGVRPAADVALAIVLRLEVMTKRMHYEVHPNE